MSVIPSRGPMQRPDLDRDLAEIFQRLDDLERSPGGGLRFHAGTYGAENSGDYLHVTTTGNDGIKLTAGGAWGVIIESPGGPVVLRGDQAQVTDTAGAGVGIIPDGPLTLQSFSDAINVQSGDQILVLPGLDLKITLNAGQKLQVVDSGDSPIFEVREDGSLHGKTGAGPLVFDL